MKLLLDTHVLLWWTTLDRRLKRETRRQISAAENDVAVSVASLWEIAIKKNLGRIDVDLSELVAAIRGDRFVELPILADHCVQLDSLPDLHRDPFDRILVAQAIVERRRLVTSDSTIVRYGGQTGLEILEN